MFDHYINRTSTTCSFSPRRWNFIPSTETVIAGSEGIVGVYLVSSPDL